MTWFTRAVVIGFAGAIALVGAGLIRAGRSGRKRSSETRRGRAGSETSLENLGLGLLAIGLMGAMVALAG